MRHGRRSGNQNSVDRELGARKKTSSPATIRAKCSRFQAHGTQWLSRRCNPWILGSGNTPPELRQNVGRCHLGNELNRQPVENRPKFKKIFPNFYCFFSLPVDNLLPQGKPLRGTGGFYFIVNIRIIFCQAVNT
jgi:hypothetical protein